MTAGGTHFTLPLPDGPGKSLVLALQPVRSEIPIYLAALGPKNLDLTGEIADGWLAIFFDPEIGGRVHHPDPRRGHGPPAATPPTSTSARPCRSRSPTIRDVAAEPGRGHAALYIGGMGSAKTNFYHRTATEMGYGDGGQRGAGAVPVPRLRGRGRGGAVRVHRPDQPAGRLGADRASGCDRLADGGVTSISVNCFDRDLESKIATLTTVIEAAEQVGARA